MSDSFMSLKSYAKSMGLNEREAKEKLQDDIYNGYWKETADGKILISFDIFSLPITQTEREVSPALDNTINDVIDDSNKREQNIIDNRDEIKRLQREIEDLKNTVKEKDKQIAEFALKFAELAQQAQQLTGQAQYLQLNDKQRKEIESAPHEEPKTEYTTEEKKSFWNIFKRRN